MINKLDVKLYILIDVPKAVINVLRCKIRKCLYLAMSMFEHEQ